MLDLTQKKNAHIDQRLRDDIIAWFSSVRPDGRPHSVPVWFLWDGQTILVFSKPNQKIRNLRQNPHVLLAMDNTRGGGDVVMLEGEAELLDDPAITAAMPAYVAKYGAHIKRIGYSPETMAQAYSQAIRITPTKFF